MIEKTSGVDPLNTTSTVRPAEAFESELTIELEPWDRHSPADWISRLASSLATIRQSAWERTPQVVAESDRRAHVSLDGYADAVADADKHTETLLRCHTPIAGLMEGRYTITVTSRKRP